MTRSAFISGKWWGYLPRGIWLLISMLAGLTALYVGLIIYRLLSADKAMGAPFFAEPWFNHALVTAHAITALPPLILGFFAFEAKFENRLKLHRWIGTIYCVCIWISSTLGVMLAIANTHGLPSKFGFGTLGTLWFTTTLMAYIRARQKKFVLHRRWMIRSFALTLAVVSVRPMFLFPPESIPYETWYRLVTWICWVPNLIVAEIYVRLTNYSGQRIRRK